MKYWQDWLSCLGLYILLLLTHGYIFGANDQMDFMPYAIHLQNQTKYTNDFYVQCINNHINERFILSHLISVFPNKLWPFLFFIAHAFLSLLLISGLGKFSNLFLKEKWLCNIIVITTLLFSYHINLGGNELYYNMLAGSLIAKSLGIWGFYYAYTNKINQAIFLNVLATYFHPMAGAQILFLSGLILPGRQQIKYFTISILCISPYIYLLVSGLNDKVDPQIFKEIMQLRNAHHFFPSSFPIKNYLLLVPLFIMSTLYWQKDNTKLFKVSSVIILGCFVYLIVISIHPKWAIMSQWFKTTIWLKYWSILSIVLILSKRIHLNLIKPYIIAFTLLFTFIKIYNQSVINPQYNIFKKNKTILFAEEVRQSSNASDLFLAPPDFTEFKYFSGRSTYIDWKAIPHNGECLSEWYSRIKTAYGSDINKAKSLNEIYTLANTHLRSLDSNSIFKLKSEGVTKIILKENNKTWSVRDL